MEHLINSRSSSLRVSDSLLERRKSLKVIEVDGNNIPQIDEIILDEQKIQPPQGMESRPQRISLRQLGLRRNQRFASLREPAQHKYLLQVPGELTPGLKSRSTTFTPSERGANRQNSLQPGSPRPSALPGRSRSMCGRHSRNEQHYLSSDRIFSARGSEMRGELDRSFSFKELSRSGNISASTTYLKEQITSVFQPSDNRLAMKLFGNKAALMKEKQRQQAVGKWVIHPCSNFRFYWDLFMLVLLIINLVTLPVAITFFHNGLSSSWITFNAVSDTVFLLDLIINFRTGIIADKFADEIILEPNKIATHYLKSWFVLDLLSSIPLDHLLLLLSPQHDNLTQIIHAGRALRVFRLVKLLSLLKLLRLSRLVRYVSQWEEFISVASKFMRIFNLISFILLLGHWNGCLQWLVPMLQDFPSNSWPALEELQNVHWMEQYTWSLFKALSHMLCIGFGRFPPQSSSDVWLTMVSMLTGAICYALFVGHSTTIIQSFDTAKRLYREKFKQVEEYMMYRKIPKHSRQKITDYYQHRYRGKMFDEKSILSEMSECLREDVINYNCRALVAAVPFFTHADPNFVTDVVTKLEFEVYQPGDYIIKESTVGTKMYFIQEGIVDIVTRDGDVATSLSDGSYFGEICLLTNSRRMASVRCETYCSLFSLSVDNFNSVLDHYPLMRRTLESVAAERLNKIGRNPGIVCSHADDIDTVNQIIQLGLEQSTNLEGNFHESDRRRPGFPEQAADLSSDVTKPIKTSKRRLRIILNPRTKTKCIIKKTFNRKMTKNNMKK